MLVFLWTLLVIVNCVFTEKEHLISINCNSLLAKGLRNGIEQNQLKKVESCSLHVDDRLKLCNSIYSDSTYVYTTRLNVMEKIEVCKEKKCAKNVQDFAMFRCHQLFPGGMALEIRQNCRFSHRQFMECISDFVLSEKAKLECDKDDFVLDKVSGLFRCNKSISSYKSMQYVCCRKFDVDQLYQQYLKQKTSSIASEMMMFHQVKKAFRKQYYQHQKKIRDFYIEQEQTMKHLKFYPKVAEKWEKKIQRTFRIKFMNETINEAEKMKKLIIAHENRLQKLFEENRMRSKQRLEYTIQENSPEPKRIAEALKLELEAILEEANETTIFLETLYMDGFKETLNRGVIKNNFLSLINESWKHVLDMIDEVPTIKNKIMKYVVGYEERRNRLRRKFFKIYDDNSTTNTPESQAEEYIRNMISNYGQRSYENPNYKKSLENSQQNSKIHHQTVLLVCLGSLIMLMVSSLLVLMYRHSNYIHVCLSSTIKKMKPPGSCKRILVPFDDDPYSFTTHRYYTGSNAAASSANVGGVGAGIGGGITGGATQTSSLGAASDNNPIIPGGIDRSDSNDAGAALLTINSHMGRTKSLPKSNGGGGGGGGVSTTTTTTFMSGGKRAPGATGARLTDFTDANSASIPTGVGLPPAMVGGSNVSNSINSSINGLENPMCRLLDEK